MFIRKILFQTARSRPLGFLIGKAAQYCPFLIPAKKIWLDRQVVGFHHPVPSYDLHAVFLPRKRFPSILHLRDEALFLNLLRAAEQTAASPAWAEQTLLFCVNAGRRQDVGQLHFHLVSLRDASGYDDEEGETLLHEQNGCSLMGAGKRLAARGDAWPALFAFAMRFLSSRKLDLSQEGFSLRILKRPGQSSFGKCIYLDFDRLVTERRMEDENCDPL